MDKSTWTGPLLIGETAHGQVHVDWTTSGLKVDWKIVNLAGDSTSSPHPVLVQSSPSPGLVLVESSFSPDI